MQGLQTQNIVRAVAHIEASVNSRHTYASAAVQSSSHEEPHFEQCMERITSSALRVSGTPQRYFNKSRPRRRRPPSTSRRAFKAARESPTSYLISALHI